MEDDHVLVSQLLEDVGGESGAGFLDLLDEWERQGVLAREFNFNITDLLVNYSEGWAEIADVIYGDAERLRVPLTWLRERVARSAPARDDQG